MGCGPSLRAAMISHLLEQTCKFIIGVVFFVGKTISTRKFNVLKRTFYVLTRKKNVQRFVDVLGFGQRVTPDCRLVHILTSGEIDQM